MITQAMTQQSTKKPIANRMKLPPVAVPSVNSVRAKVHILKIFLSVKDRKAGYPGLPYATLLQKTTPSAGCADLG